MADTTNYDEMTSFDLYAKHKSLLASVEARVSAGEDANSGELLAIIQEAAQIKEYAEKQLNETTLDRDNAPMVNDYVNIMKTADSEYVYAQEDELKQHLQDYDETYGLDGDLPDAQTVLANQNKWVELTVDDKFVIPEDMKEDEGFKRLAQSDPETTRETLNLLRSMTLTELALETPEEDEDAAQRRYMEKLGEVSSRYQTSVNSQIQAFDNSDDEQKKWIDSYIKDGYITLEEWDEAQKDPDKKKALEADFVNYVISGIYTANNGVYTENNAIYASRMAQKVGLDEVVAPAKEQKRTFTQKHPKLMKFLKEGVKNMVQSGVALVAAGPIGLTAISGWKLKNTVMSSWKNYKSQTEGKPSAKGFFNYLRNNKEEAYNLAKQAVMFGVSAAFTGAMAATGVLSFGALGSVTGLGAASAGQAVAMSALKMKMMGALTAVTSAGSYMFARNKLKPKEKELKAILAKYAPTQEEGEPQPQKKGLWGKIVSKFSKKKDPADEMYSKLTGVWKDLGDEQKVEALLSSYAPNMTAEDKAAVIQLAKDVQDIKAGSYGALAGTAIGIGLASAPDIANAMNAEHSEAPAAPAQEAPVNTGGGIDYDPNKTLVENLQDNEWHPQPITGLDDNNENVLGPLGQQESEYSGEAPAQEAPAQEAPAQEAPAQEAPAPEAAVEAHALTAEQLGPDTDLYKATQIGPTVIYKKLVDMGVMSQEDADKIMADEGRSYIPSRVLREHLQDDIKFTPEQEKEFNDFINDKQTFQKLCDEENARAGIHNGGHGNGGHSGVDSGESKVDNVDGGKTTVEGEQQKELTENEKKIVELKGRVKNTGIFNKKHEFEAQVESTGNFRGDVDEYAKAYAMHKKGITNPADLDDAKYSVSGRMNDSEGVEHKFKVKNNGDTHSVKVDGATVKTRTVGVGENQHTVTTYKNMQADASTVGAEDGSKPDEMIGAVSDDKGNHTVYVRDGDTKKIYEVRVDENGSSSQSESSIQRVSAVRRALNHYKGSERN